MPADRNKIQKLKINNLFLLEKGGIEISITERTKRNNSQLKENLKKEFRKIPPIKDKEKYRNILEKVITNSTYCLSWQI